MTRCFIYMQFDNGAKRYLGDFVSETRAQRAIEEILSYSSKPHTVDYCKVIYDDAKHTIENMCRNLGIER